MVDGRVLDSELVQTGEQAGARRGHGRDIPGGVGAFNSCWRECQATLVAHVGAESLCGGTSAGRTPTGRSWEDGEDGKHARG
jgi:hypothetical protein